MIHLLYKLARKSTTIADKAGDAKLIFKKKRRETRVSAVGKLYWISGTYIPYKTCVLPRRMFTFRN
jgi:hypothetical protein